MSEVLQSTVKVVAAPTGVAVVSEAAELLVGLARLVNELRGSRGMCKDLVEAVSDLLPQLERMASGGKINATATLNEYITILRGIREFLEIHLQKDILTRLSSHWNVKERIKDFYIQRDRLIEKIGIDFVEEAADRHLLVSNGIQAVIEREELIEKQAKEEFAALQELVTASFSTLRRDVAADVTSILGSEVATTLADIKFQIKYCHKKQTQEEHQFLVNTLNKVARAKGITTTPSLSSWYVSRADIRFETSPFARNETRSLHLGTLSSGSKVAVKVVDPDEDNTVKGDWFRNEVERWHLLRHPNVLPLYGACHITTPRLLVLAHAEKGNFKQFLTKNRHLLWKLFLDAAHGLAYLHSRAVPIVHANLKCSNLLVMADGTGVVSDFEYAFARASSNMSAQEQSSSMRWKAPECLEFENTGVNSGANPRVESDVYSLGMCVYEALTGHEPFHELTDIDFLVAVEDDKKMPPRPDGVCSDDEWSLIQAMCAHKFQDRIKMGEVVRLMTILAEREKVFREKQHCTCEFGVCSDCGRSFSSAPVSPPPPTINKIGDDTRDLIKTLQATALQCCRLLESVEKAEADIEQTAPSA